MSEIRANTISDAAGTGPVTLTKQSAAKMLVSYNSDLATPSIRHSLNVASLTDNGTGYITVNFASAFDGVEYVGTSSVSNGEYVSHFQNYNANTVQTVCYYPDANVYVDNYYANFAIHGDLA